MKLMSVEFKNVLNNQRDTTHLKTIVLSIKKKLQYLCIQFVS